MRTQHLLLIGALVALAAIGAVAAQTASSSDSASVASSPSTGDVPAEVAAHAGHKCPMKDHAVGSDPASASGSSSAA